MHWLIVISSLIAFLWNIFHILFNPNYILSKQKQKQKYNLHNKTKQTLEQEHNQYHVILAYNQYTFFHKEHIQLAFKVHTQYNFSEQEYILLSSILNNIKR